MNKVNATNSENGLNKIDDALSRRIIAALNRLPDWSNSQISLRVLEGGITNRNFVAEINGGTYVVRVPGERTEVLGINRIHEANAAKHAATLGLAPPIVGELPGFNTLVTKFVDGQHLAGKQFTDRLPEVVELIKRFHQSGAIDGSFPIHRIVEAHVRDAQINGVDPPRLWLSLHQVSLRIESAFAKSPENTVACHNDLLPTNVLFDLDRTWLLDFEYAGMNNLYFDLGNLSVNTELDEAGDETILTCYFDKVTSQRWAKLQLMKIMSELREGLWAVVQQAISTLDTDFVAYADSRLINCERLATARSFERYLSDAAS